MTGLEGTVPIFRFMENLNSFLADKPDIDLALKGVSSQVKLFSEGQIIRIRSGTELGNKCAISIAQQFPEKSFIIVIASHEKNLKCQIKIAVNMITTFYLKGITKLRIVENIWVLPNICSED